MKDFHNFQGFLFDFEGFAFDFEGFKSVFKSVSYEEAFEEFDTDEPLFEMEEESSFLDEFVYVTEPYEGEEFKYSQLEANEEMHHDPLEMNEETSSDIDRDPLFIDTNFQSMADVYYSGKRTREDALPYKEEIQSNVKKDSKSAVDGYLSDEIFQRVYRSDKVRIPDHPVQARSRRSKIKSKKDHERWKFASNNNVLKKLAESPFPSVVLKKLPVNIIGKRLKLSKIGCEGLKKPEALMCANSQRVSHMSAKRSPRKSKEKKIDSNALIERLDMYVVNSEQCRRTSLISTRGNFIAANGNSFNPYVLSHKKSRSIETANTDSHCAPAIRCLLCNFTTHRAKTLKKHMTTHRQKCANCNFETSQKREMETHLLTHSHANQKREMETHLLTHSHANQKREMETHLLTHSYEKIFHCFECDYNTRIKSCIRAHLSVHFEFKLLKCSECEYECDTKDNLKVHLQTHFGND